MNKKKFAQTFLSLAVTLLIGLGIFEYIFRLKTEVPEGRCQINDVDVTRWPTNETVLYAVKNYVVTYSKSEKVLKNYSWSVRDNQLSIAKESAISLVCETPGYNCFQNKLYDQPLGLSLLYFKPPYGLAKTTYGKREVVFPIFWDAKESLKLGSPIQMCSKVLDARNYEMAIIGSRLYVYQESTRLFGGFDLGLLNGASPMSAAREPDELYSVSNSGQLMDASCAEAKASLVGMFWVPHRDSFVFYSPNESLSLYYYDRSLNRVQLSDGKPNWVLAAQNGYLFIEKNSLTVISEGKKTVKTIPGLNEFSSNNIWNLTSFFWNELNFIGAIDSRSWLSSRKMSMLELASEAHPQEHLNLGFSFSSRKEEFSASVADDFKFLYYWEQSHSGDLSIKSVSCR